MSIPADQLPSTCDIYRPFGAMSPTTTNVRCRLVSDFADGRARSQGGLTWTHYLDLDAAVVILDGVTRPMSSTLLSYTDGDEVRIPTGATTPRFVVVWVERVNPDTPREFKRAYLIRDTA